jgi:hypothetical protein
MKRPIAILFIFLILLQGIPVLDFFFADRCFYAYVDEDKPEETKLKEKKESSSGHLSFCFNNISDPLKHFISNNNLSLPSPYLESFTPPPNSINC